MTTFADRIADFEAQANQLLDLPQQIADTAQARINDIGAYYQQRLQMMEVTAYVHQLVGDDTADGSENAPLKSIEEALRRTPPGGICICKLQGDYHFATSLFVENKYLIIRSDSTLRHALTFERSTRVYNNNTHRRMNGIVLGVLGGAELFGLQLVMPPLDGTWGNHELDCCLHGFIQIPFSNYVARNVVKFYYCDVIIPASPYGPIVGGGGSPHQLFAYALTAPDQPLNGHWYADVAAGTDTTTLPWLTTNLGAL